MIRRPPRSTLFPDTPLSGSALSEESDRDLLLVAGGTGLAPLKALVDQVARQGPPRRVDLFVRSEEHTSELQSRQYLVCRLLLEKKNTSLRAAELSRQPPYGP